MTDVLEACDTAATIPVGAYADVLRSDHLEDVQQVLHEHLEIRTRMLVLAIHLADVGVKLLNLLRAQGSHVAIARVELQARAFALSIFPTGARQTAGKLGRSSANVPNKLEGIGHHAAPVTHSPVLDEGTGWLDCRVVSEQPAGDHVLVVAEVVEAGVQREERTLTLEETGFRYAG